MPDPEKSHDQILVHAMELGIWKRACDLFLNGFIPNECPDIVKTVKRDYKESPPVSIKASVRGRDGLVWHNVKRCRSSWLR